MPMHDWTRVEAGIFHHFHHAWISSINNALNRGLLPSDFYALAEQVAAGFGPDVLTLQDRSSSSDSPGSTGTLTRPQTKHFAEQVPGLRPRRKSRVVVRHISNDRIVAMIEIVSPGNKDSTNAVREFVHKASELLDRQIHLLFLDPFPPGRRDPHGIHSAIWEEYASESFELPAQEPLTFVSYESTEGVRAYIETLAVGNRLPDMPLFLRRDFHILIPLETTYQAAWETVPTRWQRVIAPESSV